MTVEPSPLFEFAPGAQCVSYVASFIMNTREDLIDIGLCIVCLVSGGYPFDSGFVCTLRLS